MSRNKNRHTRYSGNASGRQNTNNKPQIVINPQDEEIFISSRGNLALVGEARPRKTPAPTPQTNIRNKAQSLSLDWDDNEALQIQAQRPLTEAERKETLYQVYVGNTWVSSCVDVISKRFTSGGWHLEEVEEGKGQEANRDKMKNFLLNINDDEDFLQFLRGVADDLDIYGEAYAEIVMGTDGLPAQLVSIDCVTMTYELDEHGNITKYIQSMAKSNRTINFKPEQIIRWWFPSKRARKVGFSPIEKLVNPTYADKSMVDWVHMFFKKGTRPSGVVELGPDSDIDDARQYIKFFRENYTGAQNAHTPPVMYGGAKFVEYGKGPIDVDFNRGRLFTREEVLAGYGVPPACIGIIESGNIGSGTGEDQDKALRNNTVDPIKQLILEKFNRRVVVGGFGITDWLVTTRYADYRSDQEIANVQSVRIHNGISTPNQERIAAGQAPYKDTGDTPIIVTTKEILPLERIEDLAGEQRETAEVTLQTQKAQAELTQANADKAKQPPEPVPPALSQNQNAQQQPGQQKAQPTDDQKQVQKQLKPDIPPEAERFVREDKNTGMMVAFMLDPQTASKLAIPGGESPEDMHVTLAYLGDKVDFKGNVAKLKKTVENFASQTPILKGVTSGIGRFNPSPSSDGKSPTIAMVNVHQLTSIRQALVQSLRADEFEVVSDFAYTPHITLSYNDISKPISPSVLPETSLMFAEMCLVIGDQRFVYPLGTDTSQTQGKESFFRESLRQWRQPVPEQLKCEQELEKFLSDYIKASRQGKTISQNKPGDAVIQHVATYLQQAQRLGKCYAALYIKQEKPKEAVIGAELGQSLLDRAKDLIGRALSWAKDLFTSKVEDLGDDVSEEDVLSALDDTALVVAETLGLTEIQSVVEETVQDEFVQAGIGQIQAVNEPGACPICVANVDAGPINIGESFPSGDTNAPFHFKCRCHTVPAGIGG